MAQSDYAVDTALAEASAGTLLTGVDGAPLSLDVLSRAVICLFPGADLPVRSVEIAEGTELKQPSSHSATLQCECDTGGHDVFMKKCTAAALAHKPWADRRRTLMYIRNEMRFYNEFASELHSRGVGLPRVGLLQGSLAPALGVDEEVSAAPGDEPTAADLATCGAMLFLEPLADGRYEQEAPLRPARALVLLKAAAKLHAAAMGDVPLLDAAAARLQRHGGSFALSIRNPKELDKCVANWAHFVEVFTASDPALFARPEVAALGARLHAASGYVAAQLAPEPAAEYATLVHGDLKAMNVFLPASEDDEEVDGALLIDFASTGVGYGMADLGMNLSHAVLPADLADGGEKALLDGYLDAVAAAGATYPREVALRHYRLGVVDYGRFVLGRFWGSASPEAFAAKAGKVNIGLVNRDVAAALAFADRVSRYLCEFEREMAAVAK